MVKSTESWEDIQKHSIAKWEDYFNGKSLWECALDILLCDDAIVKAEKTFAACDIYERGLVPIESESRPFDSQLVPNSPPPPTDVELVRPTRVKNSNKKHIIHALIHAERNAIDLSWDVILRFGYDSSQWVLPKEVENAKPELVLADAKEGTSELLSMKRLPDSFFKDWVIVAYEEAVHFSKWRLRLQALGFQYGDFPCHDSLWDSARDTMNMLARMAVVHCVHEARGLDVADGLAAKLGRSDPESVEIIAANIEEEVMHVKAGRVWLEYLCHQLGYDPVTTFHSLVRAFFHGDLKPPFNADRRGRAGMTPEWYLPLSEPDTGGPVELTIDDMV